jgi:hypothetical protein
VISMLAEPNIESGANIECCVSRWDASHSLPWSGNRLKYIVIIVAFVCLPPSLQHPGTRNCTETTARCTKRLSSNSFANNLNYSPVRLLLENVYSTQDNTSSFSLHRDWWISI